MRRSMKFGSLSYKNPPFKLESCNETFSTLDNAGRSLARKNPLQAVDRILISWHDFEDGLIFFSRRGFIAPHYVIVSQVKMGLPVFRFQRDRAAIFGNGFVALAQVCK